MCETHGRCHDRTLSRLRVTLGPKSKCVLIERKFGKPLVCNDSAHAMEPELV